MTLKYKQNCLEISNYLSSHLDDPLYILMPIHVPKLRSSTSVIVCMKVSTTYIEIELNVLILSSHFVVAFLWFSV